MDWYRNIGWVLVLLLSGVMALPAQTARLEPIQNSPLSRFGLGDPVNQTLAAQVGLAGLSAAYQSPLGLNLLNPASLAFQQTTSFEVGLWGQYKHLEDDLSSVGQWSGNLNYLALGFPLYNPINRALDRIERPFSWGMSLSLQPYTLVGYDIQTQQQDPQIGQIRTNFRGNGGTYRVMWGNGLRFHNFSIGVQVGYLFGKISNSRRIEYDSLTFNYSSQFLSDYTVSGFTWNVGLMYIQDFKSLDEQGRMQPNGKRLVFGAFGRTRNGFSTNSRNFFFRDNLVLRSIDTIFFEDNLRGSGSLPMEFTAGITYEQVNKLRVGLEYYYGQWSGYFNDANLEGSDNGPDGLSRRGLRDNWRITAGLEYIPDFNAFGQYHKKVNYRLGAFYGTDPRSLGGEQLDTYGLSLGFGIPIIRPREVVSYINLGVEAGRIGVGSSLEESYVRINLGFSLNDNTWFFKRKFN